MAEALEKVTALRLEGRIPEALELCETALKADVDNVRVLSLSAACLAELGRGNEASKRAQRALKLAEQDARVLLDVSVVHELAGDLAGALALARTATDLEPKSFAAWGRRGDLAGQAGDMDDAMASLEAAHKLEPTHDGVCLLLAGAHLMRGAVDESRKIASALSGEAKASDQGLRLQLALAHQGSDWAGAIAAGEALSRLHPRDIELAKTLAFCYRQAGFFKKAAKLLEPFAEREDGGHDTFVSLGQSYLGARQIAQARGAFERAVEIHGQSDEALVGLARIATIEGRLEDAAALNRAALKVAPDNVDAWSQLVEVVRGQVDDRELAALVDLTQQPQLSGGRKASALFSLAEVLHARSQFDQAMETWRQANATSRQSRAGHVPAYDRARVDADVKRWLAFDAPGDGGREPANGPQPIFVVGMPRSGTTMIESILAAHSQVASGGELPLGLIIQAEFHQWAKDTGWDGGPIAQDRLDDWKRRYLAQYEFFDLDRSARFITDKQPANSFAIGLLRHLFPDAPVIHVERDPVEVGFSIFRRNFSRHWAFADDLEDIAHNYGAYTQVMDHWEDVFGRSIMSVKLETLIGDFEQVARRLVGGCGLHFDHACLRYWEVERPVITFSASQVRRAPNSEHLDHTSPYRTHLADFINALSGFGVVVEGNDPAGPQDSDDAPERAGKKSFWSRFGMGR